MDKLDRTENFFENFSKSKIEKIKKFNSDNYEADWNNYLNSINSVYNIITSSNNIRNILLFGYIQSGKTDFIIGLILKLFTENKVNIIFSINQNNKTLLNQTLERINETYNKNIYNQKTLKKDFQNVIEKIKNRENLTIFLLKNSTHLKLAIKLLHELNILNIQYNALIIDDEGDAASFDNVWKEEETCIFNKIKQIKELSNSKFISITATPFAHFLLDKNSELKPDSAYVLEPSTGYVGIDYFVNSSISEQLSNFVEIKPIEKDRLDELFINEDFINAIKTYIVQCYWWKYIKQFVGKPRMLINIHKKKVTHEQISAQIKKIKDDFKKDDNFDCQFKFLGIDTTCYYNDFLTMKNNILDEIDVEILNGDNELNKSLDKSDEENYKIVIGHTKLDRGLTIVDLINTFISSRSTYHPNADVILQQARFLGYRDKYKEKIRVFLTSELINDYEEINFNSNYFKEIITRKENFKEIENYIPIKREKFYPSRETVANYEFINGNDKNDIINNIYKNEDDILNHVNKNFFEKFNKLFNNEYDTKKQKIIEFKNWWEFAKKYELKTWPDVIKYLQDLTCKGNDFFSNKIIEDIVNNWDKKIVIRLIKENRRKLSNKNMTGYYSIGKGNYSSNELEYWLKNDYLSIDIIPINVYSDDNKINQLIYRTRIFIPQIFIKNKTGYIS